MDPYQYRLLAPSHMPQLETGPGVLPTSLMPPNSASSRSIITPQATKNVANAYVKVIDEVCKAVKETFLDEGVEVSVLQELRRLWEHKLSQSKVLDNSRPYAAASDTMRPRGPMYNNSNNSHQLPYMQQQQQQQPRMQQHSQLQQQQPIGVTRVQGAQPIPSQSQQQLYQQMNLNNQMIRLPSNQSGVMGLVPHSNPSQTMRIIRPSSATIQPHQQQTASSSTGTASGATASFSHLPSQPNQTSLNPAAVGYSANNLQTQSHQSSRSQPPYTTASSSGLTPSDFVQIDGAKPPPLPLLFTTEEGGPNTGSVGWCPQQSNSLTMHSNNSQQNDQFSSVASSSQINPSTISSSKTFPFLQLDGASGATGVSGQDSSDDSEDEFVDDTSSPKAKVQKTSVPAGGSGKKGSKKINVVDDIDADEDEDDDDDDDDDDSEDEDESKIKDEFQDVENEEEPLNSDDDVTDDETNGPSGVEDSSGSSTSRSIFGCEDVVVCQYEKVRHQKNRWHIVLKDGVMNVQGRDVLFHRAEVDCDW